MKTRILEGVLLAVILMSFMIVLTMAQAPSEPHNADAMWVEPSSDTFVNGMPNATVGQKFNVTVWLNMTEDIYGWQVKMRFNTTQLNVTRAGLTAGGASMYFSGHVTTTAPAAIDNTLGTVLVFESCQGFTDFIPGPHGDSLFWAEFAIHAAPTMGNFASKLDISTEYGTTSRANTWVIASDGLTQLAFSPYDGNYLIIGPSGPPPLLVSISPSSASVSVNQTLLFTSTITGGTSSYNYQWFLNGTAVLGATSGSWSFNQTSTANNYNVYLNVTDSLGVTVNSNIASVTVVMRLLGDVNGDGKVDGNDIIAAARAFASIAGGPRWNPDADLNGDGRVDGRDLIIIARNFGKGFSL
jgi:hypothetical protein